MTSTPATGASLSGTPGEPGGGSPLQEVLQALSPTSCGCVLTLALATDGRAAGAGAGDGAGDGLEALPSGAALSGPEARACRAALAALGALNRADRARSIARLRERVRAPVPAGIDQIHPGWLRGALEEEASELLLALTDGLPAEVQAIAREIVDARGVTGAHPAARDAGEPGGGAAAAPPPPVDLAPRPARWADSLVELRRAVFAPFVAMPAAAEAERPGAPGWVRLATLPVAALIVEIGRRGAEVLGTSLAGAPPAVVARAAAGVGGRDVAGGALAASVLTAARRAPTAEERDRARALVSAAAALPGASDLGPTMTLGLAALARELSALRAPLSSSRSWSPGEVTRVIAQRLPPRLGRILLDHAAAAPPGAAA